MGLGCALHTHVLPCLRVPRASPRVTCSVARRSARESRFYISRFNEHTTRFFLGMPTQRRDLSPILLYLSSSIVYIRTGSRPI